MPSLKSATAVVATAILALGAQAQLTYEIDPNSVPIATRQNWCSSQIASCPLLCLQLSGTSSSTTTNTCDPTTLDYQCTCGNGQAPSAASYSQTIPYFECTEYGNQCVAACGAHDSACQTACRVDNPCGAQDPVTSTKSTAAATAMASSTDAPSASNTGSSSSSSGSGSSSGSSSNNNSDGSNLAATTSGSDSSSTGGSDSPSATNTGFTSSPTTGSKDSGAQSAFDAARGYGLAVVFTGLIAGFAMVM